jgi:hypothetical protein
MSLTRLRYLSCLLATLIAAPYPAAAFDTPLSDTAVREAYFLGQRRDDSLSRFFEKYTKHLPPPKSGPAITTITFLTPFALIVQHSSRQGVYSAQQAEIDHRNQGESVRVVVQFAYLDIANSASNGYTYHPNAFWKDFDFQILDKERPIKPVDSSAEPIYSCSEEGGCLLTGATLTFDFLPEDFTSDTATVHVIPPNGDTMDVQFDLSALR